MRLTFSWLAIMCCLAAVVFALPSRCPRKFIQVTDTYGRLNNNIYTFKNALWLAQRTNRTCVVADSDPYISRIEDIFDINALAEATGWCIITADDHILQTPGFTVMQEPGTPYNGKSMYEVAMETPEIDILKVWSPCAFFGYFYNTPDNMYAGSCEASNEPLYEYREFRGTEYDKKFDAMFYANFNFKPIFHKFAESYQQRYLTEKYIAVHLRSFGGNCHWPHFFQWMTNNANIRALDSCNINTTVVDEIMRLSGHDPRTYGKGTRNLFMATDFEEKETDRKFAERGFIAYKATTDAATIRRSFKGFDVIMDMVMLLRSELFIGTEHSTLAKLIGGMRRMRGKRSLLTWPSVD